MKKRGKGKEILHNLVDPIFPKFKLKDLLQVLIGASILAVPIGFTEETWLLGEALPLANTLSLLALSVFFISMFTYYHYHKHASKPHWDEFTKRIFFTYAFSFITVALILTIIQKAPWNIDSILALKRTVIVTFPSSMSAAIADTLK